MTTDKTPASKVAEEQGRSAARIGLTPGANPYLSSTPLFTLWKLAFDAQLARTHRAACLFFNK